MFSAVELSSPNMMTIADGCLNVATRLSRRQGDRDQRQTRSQRRHPSMGGPVA
jgi:hypothetical protein